jgi:hypothetical protein
MQGHRLIIVGFTLLALSAPGASQEPQHGTERPTELPDTLLHRNTAGVFFERNLNTFNWTGRATIDTLVGQTRIALGEQYMSNIIQIDATAGVPRRRFQTTQHTLSLSLGQPITPTVSTIVEMSTLTYSDDKAVGLSTAASHSVLGGFAFRPFPFLSISPAAGYRWENQLARDDHGLSYNLGAQLEEIETDGYLIRGDGQFHRDQLDPRLLERHTATLRIQKTFLEGTRDSLDISFFRNRREFYTFSATGPDNTIESRIDNLFSFTNLLDYELERNLITSLYVNVTNRALDRDTRTGPGGVDSTVRFDTEIREFRLDTYLQGLYRSDDGKRTAWARISYNERDENHRAKPIPGASPNVDVLFNTRNRQEQSKDNLTRRTAIAASLAFPLSRGSEVSLSGAGSLLRYDTPSEFNLEDRDELLVALTITSHHRISRALTLSIALDGSLSHLVYLLKERSANNNYNRIIRLSPRVEYHPMPGIASINTFEVLANYTVYDYEQQVALVRSFSYRQFGWMDSTSVALTSRIGLDFFSFLKLYERGQLRWSDFTERLENAFVDRTYALQLRFVPEPGSVFAVGIQYFSQSRYVYEPAGKRLEAFLRSVGPTCGVEWEMNRFSTLRLKGWYEERTLADGTRQSLPNMTMNVSLHF